MYRSALVDGPNGPGQGDQGDPGPTPHAGSSDPGSRKPANPVPGNAEMGSPGGPGSAGDPNAPLDCGGVPRARSTQSDLPQVPVGRAAARATRVGGLARRAG